MRTLFIAVGKVFGLLQIYSGIAYITSMLPLIRVFNEPSSPTATTVRTFYGSSFTLTVVSMICTLVLTFGVAWLLLFRAAWLADKLKVPDDEPKAPFEAEALLSVGIRLIGIFFVIQSAPQLIGHIGRTISRAHQIASLSDQMGSGMLQRAMFDEIWSSIVIEAVKLTLALFLVFKTNAIINRIRRTDT